LVFPFRFLIFPIKHLLAVWFAFQTNVSSLKCPIYKKENKKYIIYGIITRNTWLLLKIKLFRLSRGDCLTWWFFWSSCVVFRVSWWTKAPWEETAELRFPLRVDRGLAPQLHEVKEGPWGGISRRFQRPISFIVKGLLR
jgi:hypothetical protein